MSSNSAIYMANTDEQELSANSQIPFGAIVRRFGRFINVQGSDVIIGDSASRDGNGYYKCDCSVTLKPSAIGSVTVQLYLDGEAYPGAMASGYSMTPNCPVNLSFPAIIRLYGGCDSATLQIRLGEEAATVTNVAFAMEKI